MGAKYDIPTLYNQAKASMRKEIPVTLEEESLWKPGVEINYPSILDLLNLAFEYNVQEVLPMLYWLAGGVLVSVCRLVS